MTGHRTARGGLEALRARLGTARWALAMAWDINKGLLSAVFAVAVALSVLPAVSLAFNRRVIADLSNFIAYGTGTFSDALPALLAYGALLALIGLSTRVNTDFIASIMNNRFTYGMQERLMDVINRFDTLELLRRNVNEDFNYIVRQSNAIGRVISGMCAIGAKAVSIASLCAVAWTLSRPVFFITLAYVAAAVALSLTFSKGARHNYALFRKAEVKAQYLQAMPMEANIAKEVRVYGCAEGVVASWRRAYSERVNMEIARVRSTEVRTFALGASFYAFLALVVAFLLVQAARGQMAPAELLTVFTLCTNLFAAMEVLTRDLMNFDDNLFRIEQMRTLLHEDDTAGEKGTQVAGAHGGNAPADEEATEEDVPAGAHFAPAGAPAAPFDPACGAHHAVPAAAAGTDPATGVTPAAAAGADPASTPVFSARHLCFSYDGVHPALTDLSFDIRPGEVVALVGSNGSGKTTLAKLLLGVFAPTSGELRFCGRPYDQCPQEYLSAQIGAFFQDFYLFHHTLAENIAYGAADRIGADGSMPRDEVLEALEKGGAQRVVAKLPGGIDTLVGKRIDKTGAEFSGGEKQLLATARAYMGDKRVLIFDEPASMLDPLAELGQFEAIRSRIGTNTGILISHRVGFARMADRIVMMDAGRIAEQGTHDELMAADGLYASFFREQACWYEQVEAESGAAVGGAGARPRKDAEVAR